jgi:hypothetical protein
MSLRKFSGYTKPIEKCTAANEQPKDAGGLTRDGRPMTGRA